MHTISEHIISETNHSHGNNDVIDTNAIAIRSALDVKYGYLTIRTRLSTMSEQIPSTELSGY